MIFWRDIDNPKMVYGLIVESSVDKKFKKLFKRDKKHLEIINKKINLIRENPYQFKPLRNVMKGLRRVHIGKSFVLIYEILEDEKIVKLLDYEHHDRVYH